MTVLALIGIGVALYLHFRRTKLPNVVVIVVDTLRADRLGCYGYPRPTSPEIDELARGGTLFTECVAQAPWTRPSMTSMLTGTYLMRVRTWPEDKHTLLAETFENAGYSTLGFSANVLLAKRQHFDRGYDHYDASPGPADNDGKPFESLCKAIWNPLERALDGNAGGRKKPLFLFVQPFDPHFSYQPHPQYDAQLPLDGAEPVSPAGWHAEQLARFADLVPEDVRASTIAAWERERGLYDQEVRYTDEWIGKLLARLRELHVLDDAIVAIVSDHGEGLYQHLNGNTDENVRGVITDPKFGVTHACFQGHARHVYEEAIRTPFILWGRGVPANVRSDEVVENVDLYPTLCGLAGIEPPKLADGRPQLEGRDLRGLFAGGAAAEALRRDFSFSYHEHVATIREHSTGLKLIAATCDFTQPSAGVGHELFHLPSDPDERKNLWSERPDDVARLLARLQRMIIDHPAPSTTGIEAPEDVKAMEGLGYIGVTGSTKAANASVECEHMSGK